MRYSFWTRSAECQHVAIMVAISVGITSTMGCGAYDSEGNGGAGGASNGMGSIGGSDVAEPVGDAIHDSRWDAPDKLEHIVAPPSNATACTLGTQCPTGNCVDGFCCDSKCDNKCMACSVAKKGSGVDGICGSIKYDTDPDNDCPSGACDGKNMCKNYNGSACSSAAQCLSKYCVDGFCCGNICMGACQACSAAKKGSGADGACGSIKTATDPDNECNPGECNGSGACSAAQTPAANGTACTSASQCQSGYCADGVCCDSWCLGNCQACTAAKKGSGSNGVCGNIGNDKDPDEECWGGSCDGLGVCKQYNGVPCTTKTQCLSGYCVDGVCCGNVCTGMCYACSEAKKGQGYDGACGPMASGKDPENECNPGECNGSGTCNQPQTPQANGTTCVSGGQCASANCVDGYCCDTTCTGTCLACSATKKGNGANGTCGPIASETNPDSECNGGKCDGTGACRYYNGATCTAANQCFSNYCVDGVCCGNVCSSPCYACSAAKKGSGSNGACGVIANNTDPDNDCNPGACNGSGACNQPQTPQANGASCALGTQCASGNCVDGVCCDTACTGKCNACSAAKKGSGTSGTCGPIKTETDPDTECPGGKCDGTGACRQYNGASCTASAQCFSNYCTDGVCCGNICNLPCYACTAAKKGSGSDGQCNFIASNTDPDNECALTCNGSGACNKAPNGSTCNGAADCVSGFCADGFCCNSACSGLCQTCAAPGSEGTCSNGCQTCTTTLGFPNAPLVEPQVVPLGGDNLAIDTADFNLDGNQDIVAVTKSSSVSVFMGQGNKMFGAPTTLLPGADAAAVVARDLNSDGLADIVVASNRTAGVSVFINQGNGTFAAKVDYATGVVNSYSYRPDMVRIADVNGDGELDVATANWAAGTVSLLLGQGNGTFPSKIDIATPANPTVLAAADLNGDAIVDLAVATQDGVSLAYRLSVSMGQGGGAFGTPIHYGVARETISLTTADVNADGKFDLVSLGAELSGAGRVDVFLNQGNGTFANAVPYVVSGAGQVIATNLNGDAFADIAVATRASKKVAVLLGQANGTLGAATEYSTANDAFSLVAVDLDNDTDKDIVTANRESLSVLTNSGTSSLSIPLFSKPNIVLGGKFLASTDFNGDGLLDLVSIDSLGETVTTLLGQPGGTFVQGAGQTIIPNRGIDGFQLANMNADGIPDLVYPSSEKAALIIRFGQSNGTFGSPAVYSELYGRAKLVVGDIDGNGTLDVAASDRYQAPATGHLVTNDVLRVWLNPGNGVLGSSLGQTLSSAWDTTDSSDSFISGGDFNGDGKFDLAVSCTRFGMQILLSQGNGQFTLASTLPAAFNHGAADVNGDGAIDLIGRVRTNGQVTTNIWLNTGAGTFATAASYPDIGAWLETGDINGDGLVDLASSFGAQVGIMLNQGNGVFGNLQMYLAGAGSAEMTLGDWNGDNRLDMAVQSANFISLHYNNCLP